MIPRIIEYSVRNRYIVLLVTAVLMAWGAYCLLRTPIDAIPDLSENQVIVFTDWMGRAPKEIDDQITYPLSVNLQGLAGVKAIRSSSEFNFSMINIIFDDSVDFYFARTRVLERLSNAGTYLPAGVTPYLAPDATALGQIFWYTVEGDNHSPDELRAIQDWYVRYQLYVPGVSQVASVGGFVREYQVDVDPDKLRAFNLPLGSVYSAISRSNLAVGGKVYFEGNAEFLIRGVGWLRGIEDIESVVVAQRDGVPILVRHLARVQMGPEYRRSMLEKAGKEAVGGVVMMRYGENPLTVTHAIKARIEQLQPGLPSGVRIVPFYERTRLINDAIGTLTDTLTEELIVASIAVILVLRHLRSALIVCATLPMAVLVAFIFMYYLEIPSNIMSLSGIAISIGLFVDAAVVMVENTTHELTLRYGGERITGDTTEVVVDACRLVGKPIFFAVMIMLVSFIPVFALGGIEGKMFHPLAWTKTFAMIGVSILAITFVPAIIPLLVRGKLQRESDNWFVRTFIDIYKPVLSALLRVPAAGIWFMGFLFILGAGFIGSRPLFIGLAALSLFFGAVFFRRWWSQGIAFVLLLSTALWSWHLPKLGREFMPPLDEGSILDMPVTVPRVSIAQAADDIRVRDAVMSAFPEVEQVVGKVGRADTPTDPSGIDMVETVVTMRPKAWWPKRKLRYDDAIATASAMVDRLQKEGSISTTISAADRTSIIDSATMDAVTFFDRGLREHAFRRQSIAASEIARALVSHSLDDLLRFLGEKQALHGTLSATDRETLVAQSVTRHGLSLIEVPRREEMTRLIETMLTRLAELKLVTRSADLLLLPDSLWRDARDAVRAAIGGERATLVSSFFDAWQQRLDEEWVRRTRSLNYELEDIAGALLARSLLGSLTSTAKEQKAWQRDLPADRERAIVADTGQEFIRTHYLWRKTKADIVKEMDSELQMPGWGNIWTQPIINRVDMLATGVRTMIGVKVYGPRQEDLTEEVVENGTRRTVVREPGIQSVSNEIAGVLKNIQGAVDVFPDQIIGRSYLQIDIDRDKAARYGVNVGDIQEAIEVAMGGRAITNTVEGRRRFPVRVRYGKDFWQTQEALKRTLVTGQRSMPTAAPMPASGSPQMGQTGATALAEGISVQIPLSDVADIRVVEGPSVIKSENGMLRSYVQLNVRDRDIVGFVEEAQQAVAEKVKLPAGFYLEWSGQFEHQVRARKTLQIIFPLVILLMFIILYMTFHDVRDALLIMLAVPGALIGGVIFQSLFGFDFSVAVWVGYIACFGEATQTGIVMLVYLHDAIASRGGLKAIRSETDLKSAVLEGAVHRLRPKLITEGCAIIGLVPMLWATGVGSEMMRPMAAPVLGGMLVADEVIDLLIPVIFNWYQTRQWRRIHNTMPRHGDEPAVSAAT